MSAWKNSHKTRDDGIPLGHGTTLAPLEGCEASRRASGRPSASRRVAHGTRGPAASWLARVRAAGMVLDLDAKGALSWLADAPLSPEREAWLAEHRSALVAALVAERVGRVLGEGVVLPGVRLPCEGATAEDEHDEHHARGRRLVGLGLAPRRARVPPRRRPKPDRTSPVSPSDRASTKG